MAVAPQCKDCKAERERRGEGPPKKHRRAPYPGPRCMSHHRQKNRLAKSGAHERRVQRTYGLQPGQYGLLYIHQEQRCPICRRATGASRMLSVDHDHKTGLVRGLLCRPCNTLLGHLRDEVEAARRVVDYLTEPPAVQLGIYALHEDFRKEE